MVNLDLVFMKICIGVAAFLGFCVINPYLIVGISILRQYIKRVLWRIRGKMGTTVLWWSEGEFHAYRAFTVLAFIVPILLFLGVKRLPLSYGSISLYCTQMWPVMLGIICLLDIMLTAISTHIKKNIKIVLEEDTDTRNFDEMEENRNEE